ncbi:helix-turn-helix transcriptional regulator [Halobellus salinisoli]|uniref:helix-turn-helix transcriptional regulator n=1 Tax=Halobellus salinisoli TaxID=3108500 RepID=UPI00300AFAA4
MRTSALWVALLLVSAAVAPASALAVGDLSAGSSPSPTDAGPPADETDALRSPAVFQQASEDDVAARTSVEIDLQSDRSAEWRIETHYALESENETRAFRSLASEYEAGESDVGPTPVLFESLQQRASESTGRQMAIENVTYHSSIDEEVDRGTLALTFRWTNFLRQGENETLLLDDVFALPTAETDEQRTWLSIFDDDQQILIRPPESYTVTGTSIPVQQRESAIILAEPSDFEGEDEALEVTYSAVGPAGRLPVGLLAGGGILAVVTLFAGLWVIQRSETRTLPWASPSPNDAPPGGAVGAPESNGGTDAPATRPADETAVDRSAESAQPVSEGDRRPDRDDPSAGDVEAGPDLSLLSDEERVEHLLEQNGGRMKQATIVDETDWSDAKVSQLLSAMADEGRVDKLRLGRENLISLPDDAEESTDAPDDE